MLNPCHYCHKNLVGGENPFVQIYHPSTSNNRVVACANSHCLHKCADEIRKLEEEEELEKVLKNSKCKNKKCGAHPTKKDGYCAQCKSCIQRCEVNINEHQKRINNIVNNCNKNYGTSAYCYFDDGGFWN